MDKSPYLPMIYGYLKRYQDDPTSRVFAPLAESYRKAGLVDEALEIAREGIRIHPHFVGGRVAFARALFDKKLYAQVVDELTPVAQDVPDNLVAQRLLADSCLILGKIKEALSAYKMLLYFIPQDLEVAKIVQELEASAYESGSLVVCQDPPRYGRRGRRGTDEGGFTIQSAPQAIRDDPSRKKARRIQKIELLQSLLQRVERYRILSAVGNSKHAS